MIEHCNVINYAEAHIGISRDRNHNRVLLFTSICFDASVADITIVFWSYSVSSALQYQGRVLLSVIYLTKNSAGEALMPEALF